MLKTNDSQDFRYTSMVVDRNVTNKNLYLFRPNLLPSVETQLMFNEATQNNFRMSFDDYYTERRVTSDMIVQQDIGPVQQVNSPRKLICAHQAKDRTSALDRKSILLYSTISIFENIILK